MLRDRLTQLWVKRFGQKVSANKHAWIFGPVDHHLYHHIALCKSVADITHCNIQPATGIIESEASFGFSEKEKKSINPAILDFYTNTACFSMDMCFRWNTVFKPVAFLVSKLFSKRLQQMNIPIIASCDPLKTSSFIVKIKDQQSTEQNFWVRRLKTADEVIFAGIYSIASTNRKNHLVKVQFPLPNGNATVFLDKKVLANGDLELTSKGSHFGDSGFYFFVKNKDDYYAKYVKCMHEKLTLKANDNTHIRGEHQFYFYGINFLTIDYFLTKKS